MLTANCYLPVPVWNPSLGAWEPVDYRHGQQVTTWPESVDLTRLPWPPYRDGDRVQFVRDETCAREGVVRMVRLRGGTCRPLDSLEEILKTWYYDAAQITYLVTARGHDHLIYEAQIVARFISPW